MNNSWLFKALRWGRVKSGHAAAAALESAATRTGESRAAEGARGSSPRTVRLILIGIQVADI